MLKLKALVILLTVTITNMFIAHPAAAEALILSTAVEDRLAGGGNSANAVYIEYRFEDWFDTFGFKQAPYIGAIYDNDGDYWIGSGLIETVYPFGRMFLEGSVGSGYYAQGPEGYDLHSKLIFRLSIGVGYDLRSGNSVSLMLDHLSNAYLADKNPGTEFIALRYWHRF